MKILSIETSCDDTGITVMEVSGGIKKPTFKVLADFSNSQIPVHIPYGGVFPALAKREHIKNLPILFELVMAKLKKNKKPVDAVAVTYGPGLEPCLWAGITFAQDLAKKWKVPLIPVNHMEGHIVSVFAKDNKFSVSKVATPALSLLVSGGHTQLIVSKKWMQYEIIGETRDDAVGEAFDKVARMLGLPYPGGPEISKLAEELREKEKQYFRGVSQADGPRGSAVRARTDSDPEKIGFSLKLPRPMLYSKDFDFSFAGLKTAVLYLIRDLEKKKPLDDKTKSAIALEFENAAIECLIHKTKKAIEKYKIKTVILGGGVACNEHLRRELKKITTPDPSSTRMGGYKKIQLLIPEKKFTGDNSLMIGIAGYLNYIKNKKKVPKLSSIKATGNLKL